jgi:putative aldouronate transport system substrate-binding protein
MEKPKGGYGMKKLLLIVAAFALATAFVAAEGQSEAATEGDQWVLNEPGTYPVVQGDEEYVFTAIAAYDNEESSGDPEESPFADWIAEKTNVRVDFVEVTTYENFEERQNLRLASGDLPDAILSPYFMGAQKLYNFGSNGTFVPLTDLIEERMPSLRRELDEYPQYESQLVMPDGEIYALPRLEAGCYHCKYSYKYWVYMPWLEELGLEIPETTDELREVLRAFATQDPNGNGRADEIPAAGATTGWQTDPLGYFMNSFIYTNVERDGGFIMRTADGGGKFVADTQEWRDGLRYMRSLAEEGLFATESFTWKEDQLKALVENPEAPLVGSVTAGWYGVFSINGGGTGRFADYHPIPPLEGPDGLRQAAYFPAAVEYHTKITALADRPDIIAQWADWFYEEPVRNQMLGERFWREGEDWRYATEEEKEEQVTRDGREPLIVLLTEYSYGTESKPFDDGWPRTAIRWAPVSTTGIPVSARNDPSRQEWRLMVATRDLYEPYQSSNYLPPNVIFGDEASDEITDLTETIASQNGLVQKWAAEFIVGQRDIDDDDDWNRYLSELDRAGVDRYEELWDEALRNY